MSSDAAIYLDYAATTPVDPAVARRMAGYLTVEGDFGNPASTQHVFGRRAAAAVEQAREQVAVAIGGQPEEVVFTSGATEANNLALKGAAGFRRDRGRHIVTAASEHHAVLDVVETLAFQGYEVTRITPGADGRVDPEAVAEAMRTDTILVSVMHANNETGVINNIEAIGAVARRHGAVYHVDAAQTGGKLPLDVTTEPIDLLSLSAHKVYGPKGIGALWVRRRPRVRLVPQLHGGGHERGLRSGTLPTHQIVGMGEALALAHARRDQDAAHARQLLEQLESLLAELHEVRENGAGAPRLPHIRNLAFAGVEGESLVAALGDRVAMATGSACSTASVEPSFVLRAMGQTHAQAAEAVRLSWGRFTSEEEIEAAGRDIIDTVHRLRSVDRAAAH